MGAYVAAVLARVTDSPLNLGIRGMNLCPAKADTSSFAYDLRGRR